MVEGGTLLRCYTSQRGIEGSNPSSSALELVYLQDKLGSETKGREKSRPLLHLPLHQPASWPCRWSGSPTPSATSFRKLVQQAMCPSSGQHAFNPGTLPLRHGLVPGKQVAHWQVEGSKACPSGQSLGTHTPSHSMVPLVQTHLQVTSSST